jgi:hypothetical protein
MLAELTTNIRNLRNAIEYANACSDAQRGRLDKIAMQNLADALKIANELLADCPHPEDN